jgi:SAM-dependent methyltransferase
MTEDPVQTLKERHHQTWAAGDYSVIAQLIEDVGEVCVDAASVEAGQDVLDVATGTGNAALVAAGRGAKVTGLDLTPELFDTARQRAAAAGVEVEWVAGDAEDMPFDDASFDRLLSTCGVQFAPRHEMVARELVRVCRPSGLIVICNWTADGMIGELFKLMGRYMPPPPDFASSPALWGDESHVRSLFDGLGVELSFEPRSSVIPFESAEEYAAHFETYYGPTLMAKQALEPDGRWEELRGEWLQLIERFLQPGSGVVQDYFVITGRRA